MNNDKSISMSLDQDEVINLPLIISTLLEKKEIIIVVTLLVGLLGGGLSVTKKPTFHASALLQIESSKSERLGFENVLVTDSVTAKSEIIKSRMLLGEVVDKLKLNVAINPKYFPFIGGIVNNYNLMKKSDSSLSPAFLGLSNYPWGGEVLELSEVILPKKYHDKALTLLVGENETYQIFSPEKELLLTGVVGKLSSNGIEKTIVIKVEEIRARTGVQFVLKLKDRNDFIDKLGANISVKEKSEKSGIFTISYKDEKSQLATDVVNYVAEMFYQYDLEQSTGETQKAIEFLKKQLPLAKEKLENSEKIYNEFRVQSDSVNVSEETRDLLAMMFILRKQKLELEQQKEELNQKYKSVHPNIKVLNGKIRRNEVDIKQLQIEINTFPSQQQQFIKMSDDVNVNRNLHNKLLVKLQELSITKAGLVGGVKIIDLAIKPKKPFQSNKLLTILLFSFFGFVAVSFIVIVTKPKLGIENPKEIESEFEIPVFATIMHNPLVKKYHTDRLYKPWPLLTNINSSEVTVEGFRVLRAMLKTVLVGARNNITVVTGASPGVGKSFTAMNLAAVLAEVGEKVVVVDSDFRRGELYKYVDVEKRHGLDQVIDHGHASMCQVASNLFLLTNGKKNDQVTGFFETDRFQSLLKKLSKKFDHVIIDTAPILAVADPVAISRIAGSILFVAKHEVTHMRELEQAINILNKLNINISGIVFNDYKIRMGQVHSDKYVYSYEYT